jgi:hypothetical protein
MSRPRLALPVVRVDTKVKPNLPLPKMRRPRNIQLPGHRPPLRATTTLACARSRIRLKTLVPRLSLATPGPTLYARLAWGTCSVSAQRAALTCINVTLELSK